MDEMQPVTEYPKILGFCCRWCSYAGADLAGSMRLQYPPEVRILMVPCTGRVDALHLLRTFEDSVDGVFVAGTAAGIRDIPDTILHAGAAAAQVAGYLRRREARP